MADERVPVVSDSRRPNRYRTLRSVRLDWRSMVEGRRLPHVVARRNPSPSYWMLEGEAHLGALRVAGWLQDGGGHSESPPRLDPARRRARGGVRGRACLR
jgi:hypothetical protein